MSEPTLYWCSFVSGDATRHERHNLTAEQLDKIRANVTGYVRWGPEATGATSTDVEAAKVKHE